MKSKIYLTVFVFLMSVQFLFAQNIVYGDQNELKSEAQRLNKFTEDEGANVYYQVDETVLNGFTTENNTEVVCRLSKEQGGDVVCSAQSPEAGWGTMVSDDNANFTYETKLFEDGVNIFAIAFTDPKNGWAAGVMDNESNSTGVIFNTTDGGSSWKIQFKGGTEMKLDAVGFNDTKNGWVKGIRKVGDKTFGILFSTFDGGNSWSETTLTVKKDSQITAQNKKK